MVIKVSNSKKGGLVSAQHSAEMAALHQKAGTQVKELSKMQIFIADIYSRYL